MKYTINKAIVGYIICAEQVDRFGHDFYAFNTLKEASAYLPNLFEPKAQAAASPKRRKTDKVKKKA